MYDPGVTGVLSGWLRQLTADGAYLVPPDGSRAAWISVRQRVAPVRPFTRVLAEHRWLVPPELRAALMRAPIRRGLTNAGEPMASSGIAGPTASGVPYVAQVAAVYTESHFLWVFGTGAGEAFTTTVPTAVHTLATGIYVGADPRRRRWYRYDPPGGWRGLRRHQTTIWYPPDFPQNRAAIHVLDAAPHGVPASLAVPGAPSSSSVLRGPLASAGKLTGHVHDVAAVTGAEARYRAIEARLQDEAFTYVLRLDCPTEEARLLEPVLLDVVASIEPIQLPGPASTSGASYSDLWVE
jgi:hypothetical protein